MGIYRALKPNNINTVSTGISFLLGEYIPHSPSYYEVIHLLEWGGFGFNACWLGCADTGHVYVSGIVSPHRNRWKVLGALR